MKENNDKYAIDKIEQAKEEVIGAISETMDLYGVTPSAGTLYATMYFQNEMNLDEMRTELGMSKPSMSTSVRKLQDNGMVKKTFHRGSRKHTYIAEKDFFSSFMSFYCRMWEREVKMNMEAIKIAEKDLKEIVDDQEVSQEIREKAEEHYKLLDKSKVYYRWLERLTVSIQNEEIFEFLPKESNEKNTKRG
ncbi:choline uptake/conversion transcriptional regulator CudC [Oceanobacillus polygoni]|uniref:HTH-type transcriptional regulator n=1 Tax=Oceanobacillus polygoni TaxID=1235259 RepID=A0A9X0YRU4_9BACI|nr:GbsR/MarR family transcriptional regulator [Oceanobacillus polygoni]MBP2076079.1 DNA-binding transcriptional regulator GbsR (MarR family) [Oceanobacillus polygoni]